ncbi:NAD(P)-binding domain-containing protein [Paraburkholderia sprentiae]|uniref:NAD(P)-binding domain-containing protein n=1 Tax=Paraburkholderia sprentiae TaxID=948107 RepID=UPI003908A9D9
MPCKRNVRLLGSLEVQRLMSTIGIIGAGEVGIHVARAAIANGYEVVISNSRGPDTLTELIDELGPSSRQPLPRLRRRATSLSWPSSSSSSITCQWKRSRARSCWTRTTT